MIVWGVVWLTSYSVAQAGSDRSDATGEVTNLGTVRGEGQVCLVCGEPVFGEEMVEARYKGRTFYVAVPMFDWFVENPERYFGVLEARGALFDEGGVGQGGVSLVWLVVGVYIVLGLLAGGVCAYVAVSKGLPAWPWFFAGLVGNVVGVGVVLGVSRRPGVGAPQGVPGGLRKVPTTRQPQPCAACGAMNHPAAGACAGCGAELQPVVEAETYRV